MRKMFEGQATFGIIYETYSFMVFGEYEEITKIFDDAIDYTLIETTTNGKIFSLTEAIEKYYAY